MSNQAYVGMTKRTFEHALIYLLENDYALLGSRRILELMVQDVQSLVEQFYPRPERRGRVADTALVATRVLEALSPLTFPARAM